MWCWEWDEILLESFRILFFLPILKLVHPPFPRFANRRHLLLLRSQPCEVSRHPHFAGLCPFYIQGRRPSNGEGEFSSGSKRRLSKSRCAAPQTQASWRKTVCRGATASSVIPTEVFPSWLDYPPPSRSGGGEESLIQWPGSLISHSSLFTPHPREHM